MTYKQKKNNIKTEEKVKSDRQFKCYMKQITIIASVTMILIKLCLIVLIILNIDQ